MTPILRDGQPVLVEPVNYQTKLKKNDIVFCRVCGYYYLHKIIAIKNNMSFQIGNNHCPSSSKEDRIKRLMEF